MGGGPETGNAVIFFHPDYTVGTGITPVQLTLADFTAGRELHPALKIYMIFVIQYTQFHMSCPGGKRLLYRWAKRGAAEDDMRIYRPPAGASAVGKRRAGPALCGAQNAAPAEAPGAVP